jgi:two-component system sensor histidine kinase/response regulator
MKTASPIRVLVAEDEAIVNEFIQNQLTNLDYEIAGCAFDGPEAVALTCRLRPDVVLMDLQMVDPQTGRDDRLAGLRAARAIQEQCPTPIILLTAFESRELVAQASAAGVGAYLVKPAADGELERAITIALARLSDLMELRRLNADLTARNEELDAYSHTVAHDLKSPLALIIGFADALAEDYAQMSSASVRDSLREIAQSGRKMNDIIDELLLLASVRKMVSVEMKALDMHDIVIDAQRQLAHTIRACQAEITLPASWPVALGYRPWVEEVWVNYLSNAITYGGSPPRVELGFGESANQRISESAQTRSLADGSTELAEVSHIRFWVRDNGPGLSPEEQARLFTPFERLEQVRAQGSGLGLSIVRRIVEKLGGQVGLQSEPGVGSVFWFTLPSG